MPSMFLTLVILTVAVEAAETNQAGADRSEVHAADLHCEYRRNPLVIDVPRPRLSWTVRATADAAHARCLAQSAYQILVASDPKLLAADKADQWNTGKVAGAETLHIAYGGRAIESRRDYYWTVRVWDQNDRVSTWSKPARWSTGPMGRADWKASWISAAETLDAKAAKTASLRLPWLRKTFKLDGRPRRAVAYISAMGYFELYVNGQKVNDDHFGPAVSDFSRRGWYLGYDIGKYLAEGDNCVAIWLGRGWYRRGIPGVVHDNPVVMAECDITASDGEKLIVGTDATWRAHLSSITPLGTKLRPPTVGDRYDARLDQPGWNTAGFDAAAWKPAKVIDVHVPLVAAQPVEPNRVIAIIEPISVKETSPGEYLVDMGRFLVGRFQIRVDGKPDRKIRIDYIEHRTADGAENTYGQHDEYVLAKPGSQTLCNRFDYHAFRWARIKGLACRPQLDDIRGLAISTDKPRATRFKCSNELLNRIYETVLWTHRCLSMGGYIADCPHREQLGYGGDAHATMDNTLVHFDAGAFFTKWMADWRDSQDPATGDLPHVCPNWCFGGGGPAWSGICVALPWEVYLQYGDKRILEVSYPVMQKWLDFLESKSKDHILQPYGHPMWGFLGDWVAPGRGQTKDRRVDDNTTLFFNNCYYLINVKLAARIAEILGKSGDAQRYAAKAESISRAIHQKFYDNEQKTYANGEQPYLALALLAEVAPDAIRPKVLDALEKAILVTHKGHLNSGIHGTYYLIKSLNREHRDDLVYSIAKQTTYPSWGHMLEQGATTIWEQWDSVHSHCHSSFLSIGPWFVEGLGGIQVDEQRPGFSHFLLRPGVVRELSFVRARYDSIRGPITSDWRIDGNRFQWDIEVPPNTTATVFVPAKSLETVAEGDSPAAQAACVRFLRMEGDRAVFSVGSGRYRFNSTLPIKQTP